MPSRLKYESLLQHTADIYRTTNTTSPTGTRIRSWILLTASVPCLIQAQSGRMQTIPDGEKTPLGYIMFVKWNCNIVEGDKVIWSTKEFLVKQAPPQDGSGTNHHREILLDQYSNT